MQRLWKGGKVRLIKLSYHGLGTKFLWGSLVNSSSPEHQDSPRNTAKLWHLSLKRCRSGLTYIRHMHSYATCKVTYSPVSSRGRGVMLG